MELKSLQLFQTQNFAINKTVYNRFYIQTICDRVHGDQYGYYKKTHMLYFILKYNLPELDRPIKLDPPSLSTDLIQVSCEHC